MIFTTSITTNYTISRTMSDSKECEICTEKFNKKRNKVKCNYCQYIACSECVETYIKGSYKDAECMSCKKAWTTQFLQVNFDKTRYNSIKTHRENVLLEREKSLLPAAQIKLEENIVKEKKKEELKEQLKELRERKIEIEIQMRELNMKIRRIHIDGDTKDEEPEEKKTYVRNCPADDCRGFLSSHYRCGLCEVWVCKECHEIKGKTKDSNHKCKKENVETAKLLMKDTKPCPKCNVPIFRSEGCQQMFCTMCHTPFDWVTGKIISHNRIHNPHFFEWQSKTGGVRREYNDMMCGGPDIVAITIVCSKLYNEVDEKEPFTQVIRVWNEVQDILNAYPTEYNMNENLDLRMSYLQNRIDEKAFKRRLQQREKKRFKMIEEGDVLRTFTTVVGEELTQLTLKCRSSDKSKLVLEDFDEVYQRCVEVKNYSNDSLKDIHKRYNNIVKGINKGWYLVNIDKIHTTTTPYGRVVDEVDNDEDEEDEDEE